MPCFAQMTGSEKTAKLDDWLLIHKTWNILGFWAGKADTGKLWHDMGQLISIKIQDTRWEPLCKDNLVLILSWQSDLYICNRTHWPTWSLCSSKEVKYKAALRNRRIVLHAKCRHPVEKGIPLAKIQPFYRHGRAKVLCQWRTVESGRVEFVPAGHWKLHGIAGDQVCASCWLSFKPNTIHCQYVCSPLLPLMVLLSTAVQAMWVMTRSFDGSQDLEKRIPTSRF